MKQLSDFFLPSSQDSKLEPSELNLTLKYGSINTLVSFDMDLRVKIKELQHSEFFSFRPECTLFPYFNQKKVSSISIYYQNSYFTLSGDENSLGLLYYKLCRLLTHKGFNQFYKPIKRIGRGTFATVYLVEHKFTGVRRAAKVFSKQGQKIQFKGKEALDNQIKTIKQIDHPNLIRYDGLYETEALIYLVTEYMSGGTLEQTLKNKAILSGEMIQSAIKDILQGLAYLDSKKIMHRDIKPENIIFRQEQNRWVISDFGLAAKSNEDYIYDKCGTMGYIAPEIMEHSENQKYAQSCDIYSLGIIAYQLIVGELPFKIQSVNFFDKKVVWIMFDRDQCKDINPDVLNFLKRLLDKNPETRINPKEALQSPFFTDEKVVGELLTFHDKKRKARYDRILKMANMN